MKKLILYFFMLLPLTAMPQLRNDSIDTSSLLNDTIAKKHKQQETVYMLDGETPPEFPDGHAGLLNFLAMNLRYPVNCVEITGRVVVRFTVEEDGSVTNPKIMKSLSPYHDKEVLRVVGLMPKWTPAMRIKGNERIAVKYEFTMPVSFKLQ